MKPLRKLCTRVHILLLLLVILLCGPSRSFGEALSGDDLFLSPSLVAADFYITHFPTPGGTQVYTPADLDADSLLGVRMLPLLKANPSPSSSEGEYSDADLAAIDVLNYSTFFFRRPNIDYFADLTPSTLTISYPTTGQFFVEVRAKKDGVEFTRIFHDQVGDVFAVSAHHRHPLAASVAPERAHEKSRRRRPTGIQRGAWPASPT